MTTPRVDPPRTNNGDPIQVLKESKTQTVTVGASSNALSTAFQEKTRVVRLVADVDCHVTFGSSPSAGTGDIYMPADTVEYWSVSGGDKVAVIRNSNDGTLWVTEVQ